MEKKNESKLSYLQMPLPKSGKYYKMTKRSWSGLNYRQTIDTGLLSMEKNISTLETPYLTPSAKWDSKKSGYTNPISMFGFDSFLIVIYRKSSKIYIDYITIDEYGDIDEVYTGILQSSGATRDDEYPRCVVQFNVYDTPTDPVTGQYVKKLLIFPDKASMFMKIVDTETNPSNWGSSDLAEASESVLYYYNDGSKDNYYTVEYRNGSFEAVSKDDGNGHFLADGMDVLVKEYYNDDEETDENGAAIYPPPETANHSYYYKNTYNQDVYRYCEYDKEDGGTAYGWRISLPPSIPNIKYAAVHLSRLFGVDDDRVYASGYNDYTNWNLDIDEYNESNAWCSPAQSNTKAGGVFTGITTFQSHVICFKRDFMHEIYNTKNPFRIQDIFAEGAIDNRTIQDVDGRLIFVSDDNVKIYTGSNPRIISYYLNIKKYVNAVSGTDGRCYYLYCEEENEDKRLFSYDTIAEQWSEQCINTAVVSFAHNKNGMYALCKNGRIYKIDTEDYEQDWSFETDLITNTTVDVKHIKKLQMFADIASGANMKVYILYDDEEFDEDTSHLVYSSSGYGQNAIRVKPRQTASYGIKLHIEGYGYVKLYELELFIESGGDLYV